MSGGIEAARWIDPSTGQPLNGTPLGMALSAQAAATPERPAFTIAGHTLTFAQFDEAANRRARDLAARGVEPGERVVLAMPNRAEYLIAAFALWKIGAVPCPVSDRLADGEFAAILGLLEARWVIGQRGLATGTATLVDIDEAPDPAHGGGPLPPAIATPGKIANSGGSTGRPKLIVDPLPSVWGPDKEGCRRGPRQTLLNPGPLYHSAPFNTCTMALAQGTHIVCMERFDAGAWLELVQRHKASYAYIVPTMMTRIAKHDPAATARADLSSLQTVLHMAAPCPPEIKRWWIQRVGAEHLWEVYGGTERIGVTTIGGVEWLERPGTVGKPAAGQQVLITDPEGHPLPAGEVGEIRFIREGGPGRGYAYIGAENRILGQSDSFGDMGWLDAEGYLYVADRRTDMVLVGGVNIWPAEIEAAVERLEDVVCCAVIGLPDADMGNRLHAVVELAPGAPVPDEAAFLARANAGLSGLKRLRSAEFTTERVRDEAGKVRRSALREARLGC